MAVSLVQWILCKWLIGRFIGHRSVSSSRVYCWNGVSCGAIDKWVLYISSGVSRQVTITSMSTVRWVSVGADVAVHSSAYVLIHALLCITWYYGGCRCWRQRSLSVTVIVIIDFVIT